MRLGMRFLVRSSLLAICILSVAVLGSIVFLSGQLPFAVFMAYLMLSFFCVGVLFGNLNSLAMETLGQVVGIGAAVVGALPTPISVLLDTLFGQSYNGTILPSVSGLAVVRWIEAS